MIHPTWDLPLNEQGAGLVLTPCPGTKGVSLQDTLSQLKAQGVAAIVTALSDDELRQANVEDLGEQIEQLGMQWVQLVIEDDCAPSDSFQLGWNAVSPKLHQLLDDNRKVALHCMGGSGRTGLLAAHVLLEQGWALEDIIREVQALRPGAFTKPVQLHYIQQVAEQN